MNNKTRLKEIISIINKNDLLNDKSPKNVRKTIEDLGPTFIKIGQILSTREDIIPNDYCVELAKLRSNVEPLSFKTIEEILKKEYGDYQKYFKLIDEKPIGAASIAQVHKAVLNTGEEVVIKVRRPNIEVEIKQDMELLKNAINILHLNHFIKIMDLNSMIDELYESTIKELNFKQEVENMNTFEECNKDIPYISSPKVIKELCNENIIVMEYINGIMISNIDELKSNGYNTSVIAKELSRNYIKQALDDGMFHADPHPDNICLLDERIIFLDWGMVGTLTKRNMELLKKCMKSIIEEDYEGVTNYLISMSKVNGELNKQKLANEISTILKEFSTLELDKIDTKKFITNMFEMLQNNGLILDHNITMLVRGIGIIEPVLKSLDSKISLTSVLKEKVIENEIKSITSGEPIKEISKKIIKTTRSLSNLPNEAEKLLKSMNEGNIKLKFELSNSKNQVDKIEKLIHELVLGFIDGCLIVAFSLTDIDEVRYAFLTGIIIISIILIIRIIKDNIHSGY